MFDKSDCVAASLKNGLWGGGGGGNGGGGGFGGVKLVHKMFFELSPEDVKKNSAKLFEVF